MKSVSVERKSIEETLKYQGVTMVNVDISYPSIGGEVSKLCARRVKEHYEREAQQQRRHARTELFDSAVEDWKFSQEKGYPFNEYELLQVCEVTYNATPVLSLNYDVYQYTGGAHGMTDRTGETWDLRRCRMLAMQDLFRQGYDYVTPILKYINVEALRRQQAGEAQYFEGLADNIVKYFDQKNYYLTCEGLTVFYPLYSIAPYYVGIQEFTVPYGMFGGNLVYPLAEMCT